MTTAMMMRINISQSEINEMLFHDFRNRQNTIIDLSKGTTS